MKDYILKTVAALVLPLVFVIGCYVIIHGHTSPGGSFAGGIIVALSFIGYATVYGLEKGKKKLPLSLLEKIESYGTLWYVVLGLVGIFKGVPFLGNRIAGFNLGEKGALYSSGLIFFLGLGVGIRVASTMVTLYYSMKEEES